MTVTTWLTHLFGGSAGREGVAVQLGATVSHAFSRYFKIPNASRLCLTMGMAAGFGGLFQTQLLRLFRPRSFNLRSVKPSSLDTDSNSFVCC
ncbi:MAG: chloride channel protein [Streptococcus sp.]